MSNPYTSSELERWEQQLNNDLSRENIEDFLYGLPKSTDPKYYPQMKTLFRIENPTGRQTIIEEIISASQPKIDVSNSSDFEDIRFAAFFFLLNYYRRRSEINDFAILLDEYKNEFGERPLYRYEESIVHREHNEYPDAIDKCRTVITENPDCWPLLIGYSHNIVHGIEKGLVGKANREKLAGEAVEKIRKVLTEDPKNSKAHLIKARALSINNRFEEALEEVDRAIEWENSDAEDYTKRIADCYFYKVRIEIARETDKLEQKSRQVEERVDNIQTRFIQFIGFFAAILAVVFTSTRIAISLSPDAAVRVILVLTSGLIIAFASLSILLPGELDISRVIFVLSLGVAGMISGIYII